jgi:beta-galactosidase GanA
MKPIGAMIGTLFAGVLLLSWIRRRARYHFPDFEVEPRLEGAHAAGIGAVISFASAAIPPASQKDQVPDYLRKY